MARIVSALTLLCTVALLQGVVLAGPVERRTAITARASPQISLLYYIWGATDESSQARAAFVNSKGTVLKVVTNTDLADRKGLYDPHPGTTKSIVALFQIGSELYTLVTKDFGFGGIVNVDWKNPYGVNDQYDDAIWSSKNLTKTIKKPRAAPFEILSVVWGQYEITNASVWQTLYQTAATGQSFTWSQDLFGPNTITNYDPYGDSGVVFSKAPDGSIQYVTGYEGNTASFPASYEYSS